MSGGQITLQIRTTIERCFFGDHFYDGPLPVVPIWNSLWNKMNKPATAIATFVYLNGSQPSYLAAMVSSAWLFDP